jgi:Icc-related predicted phosphoesterase
VKIQVLSDLHIEFSPFTIPAIDSDVVVLAGDIHVGEKGAEWAIENIKSKPVIYVLGNHEYYGSAYPRLLEKIKNRCSQTNVTVLENSSVSIEDVTFFGCTLWTDFELLGDRRRAVHQATEQMMDFRKIRVSPKYSRLKALDLEIIHKKSLSWLRQSLSNNIDKCKKVVVITHHAPSSKSVPSRYQNDILSAAYASNLDQLVSGSNVALWVHGHIHDQSNYQIGSTRVICNPRGYPDELNTSFDPGLTIEI